MKYSKQRDKILNYVRSVKCHPTAEEVYNEVREELPNISLGTVYRNLDLLSESGDIRRIKIANSKDRFDGDLCNHYHAVCVKCGSVQDIFTDYFSSINDEIENKLNCKVLSHDVIFNTICQHCKN